MTARFIALLLLALALAGCRCTVAVSFGDKAEATMEAGKLYDGNTLTPSLDLDIPLMP